MKFLKINNFKLLHNLSKKIRFKNNFYALTFIKNIQ